MNNSPTIIRHFHRRVLSGISSPAVAAGWRLVATSTLADTEIQTYSTGKAIANLVYSRTISRVGGDPWIEYNTKPELPAELNIERSSDNAIHSPTFTATITITRITFTVSAINAKGGVRRVI